MTHRTTRCWTRAAAVLAGAAMVASITTPVGAAGIATRIGIGGRTTGTAGASGCRQLTVRKDAAHAAAARRERALAALVVALQARHDPWSMNAAQISTLQSANSAISALDAKIQGACYATVAAFHADATQLFVAYRVYWLRVPQTHGIEAADRLGEARTRLGTVATKLAAHVGADMQAHADLVSMNQALAGAGAKLGTQPTPAADIVKLSTLSPAADMTADVATMQAARSDLEAARAQLVEARADGLKVIADLGG